MKRGRGGKRAGEEKGGGGKEVRPMRYMHVSSA